MTDDQTESLALRRLNELPRAGYRVEPTHEDLNAIWLRHPARRRAAEPTLILYPSGLVVGDGTRDKEQFRLHGDKMPEFESFVKSVPKPTLWERSERARDETIALIVLLLLASALGAAATATIDFLLSGKT